MNLFILLGEFTDNDEYNIFKSEVLAGSSSTCLWLEATHDSKSKREQ